MRVIRLFGIGPKLSVFGPIFDFACCWSLPEDERAFGDARLVEDSCEVDAPGTELDELLLLIFHCCLSMRTEVVTHPVRLRTHGFTCTGNTCSRYPGDFQVPEPIPFAAPPCVEEELTRYELTSYNA